MVSFKLTAALVATSLGLCTSSAGAATVDQPSNTDSLVKQLEKGRVLSVRKSVPQNSEWLNDPTKDAQDFATGCIQSTIDLLENGDKAKLLDSVSPCTHDDMAKYRRDWINGQAGEVTGAKCAYVRHVQADKGQSGWDSQLPIKDYNRLQGYAPNVALYYDADALKQFSGKATFANVARCFIGGQNTYLEETDVEALEFDQPVQLANGDPQGSQLFDVKPDRMLDAIARLASTCHTTTCTASGAEHSPPSGASADALFNSKMSVSSTGDDENATKQIKELKAFRSLGAQ